MEPRRRKPGHRRPAPWILCGLFFAAGCGTPSVSGQLDRIRVALPGSQGRSVWAIEVSEVDATGWRKTLCQLIARSNNRTPGRLVEWIYGEEPASGDYSLKTCETPVPGPTYGVLISGFDRGTSAAYFRVAEDGSVLDLGPGWPESERRAALARRKTGNR